MRIKNLGALLVCLCFAAAFGKSLRAQELAGLQNFGIFSSFAPDSSHILIGDAEKRRIWTV
jgi:hypothetical protein